MESVAVTGHRPSKLDWGYDYNEAHWVELKEIFKEWLVANNVRKAFTGMALGVDMVFALAVLELKLEGYDIALCAVVPCNRQWIKWPESSKATYFNILSQADEIVGMSYFHEEGYVKLTLVETEGHYQLLTVDNEYYAQPYHSALMTRRNNYMVDNADGVLAVWEGIPGGTANCVEYAQSINKTVYQLRPSDIKI